MDHLKQEKINADEAKRLQEKQNKEHAKKLAVEERRKKASTAKATRLAVVMQQTEKVADSFTLKGQKTKFAKIQKNQPEKKYSIIRVKTHKTTSSTTGAFKHIERLEQHSEQEHLNPQGSIINCLSMQPGANPDDKKAVNPCKIIEELQQQNRFVSFQRDKGFSCVEMLLTLSPDVFDSIKPEHRADFEKQFAKDCASFLKQRFDGARICSMTLHLDEQTPHLHAMVLPLTIARGKNKQPLKNAEGKTILTTSKRSIGIGGHRDELVNLHTQFANHLRKRGYDIERGEVAEPMAKTHQELKQFKAQTQREFSKKKAFGWIAEPMAKAKLAAEEALTSKNESKVFKRFEASLKYEKKRNEKLEAESKQKDEKLKDAEREKQLIERNAKQMQEHIAQRMQSQLAEKEALIKQMSAALQEQHALLKLMKAKTPQQMQEAYQEIGSAKLKENEASQQKERFKAPAPR